MSKQQDIVIHESHFCPVFIVNDTPEATYYPVEGVIAVGEVKSTLDRSKLEDAFSKIVSAKSLKRYEMPEDDGLGLGPTVPYRTYGSPNLIAGAKVQEFNQTNKEEDQLFGFILCGGFSLKTETVFCQALKLWKQYPRSVSPNLIISLNDGFLQPYDHVKKLLFGSPLKANAIMMCHEPAKGFPHLIRRLNYVARNGRTVSLSHFGRYLDGQTGEKERFQVGMVGQL
jgi:hypothetical protein